ncbi:MAG: AIR carboxylase family protein [Candidatus Hadarchaeales archaeon]
MSGKVEILLGSKADLEWIAPIEKTLKELGVKYGIRIASAHKTPRKLLSILEENERSGEKIVYITVAGRSNALSGFVDANTRYPVIACPPYSEKFGGADIFSSLRMPSGVAPTVILDPEGAAMAAAKVLALGDDVLSKKISEYHAKMAEKIESDDRSVKRG